MSRRVKKRTGEARGDATRRGVGAKRMRNKVDRREKRSTEKETTRDKRRLEETIRDEQRNANTIREALIQ
eukprot:5265031-Lingulodinium_polyedra.AAC.1